MIPLIALPPARLQFPNEARLRDAAVRLEAGFFKQMLSAARRRAWTEGRERIKFSSFLLDEQALRLAQAGGIGLAESIFESLKARDAL